jgi:hypothetical protein
MTPAAPFSPQDRPTDQPPYQRAPGNDLEQLDALARALIRSD